MPPCCCVTALYFFNNIVEYSRFAFYVLILLARFALLEDFQHNEMPIDFRESSDINGFIKLSQSIIQGSNIACTTLI